MTPEDAAWCAAQWASGVKQRDIARQFGFRHSSPVCWAIRGFLREYSPELPLNSNKDIMVWGGTRKPFVKQALARFVAARASE